METQGGWSLGSIMRTSVEIWISRLIFEEVKIDELPLRSGFQDCL